MQAYITAEYIRHSATDERNNNLLNQVRNLKSNAETQQQKITALECELEKAQRELKQKDNAIAVLNENNEKLKKLSDELQELTKKQKIQLASRPQGIDLGAMFGVPKTSTKNAADSKLPEKKGGVSLLGQSISKGTNTGEDDVLCTENFPII